MKNLFRLPLLVAAAVLALTFFGCENPAAADDATTSTVSGTITLPASVANKPFLVIVDADTDGSNVNAGTATGTANGTSFDYSIPNVAAGNYYIYAIVYTDGTADAPPAEGDYFGAHGITAITAWPNTTPKITVTAGDSKTADFSLYLVPAGFGDGDDESSGHTSMVANEAFQAYGRAAEAAAQTNPLVVSNFVDTTSGYTVSGSMTFSGTPTVQNGTITLTGGTVTQFTFVNVANDGSSGTATVTFSDSAATYTFTFGANTLIQN